MPDGTMDWDQLTLHQGILREPTSDGNRLVLWAPGECDAHWQHWQRIGTVLRAAITRQDGLSLVAATSIRARQRIRRGWGGFLRRFRRAAPFSGRLT